MQQSVGDAVLYLPNRPGINPRARCSTLDRLNRLNLQHHDALTSTLYRSPFVVSGSMRQRVSAFQDGKMVCRESIGNFARMKATPELPDVYLGDLQPVRSVGFGHGYANEVRYSGDTQAPQTDKSNRGGEISINRQTYARGLGVHAPCEVVYELKPEYQRFVGLAGVDEYLISRSNGSKLAMHPSVVFKVYIDGREAATSPVMRILSPAWRFDVDIPKGSQKISLIAMDAGDGSREDFADWANAGFMAER